MSANNLDPDLASEIDVSDGAAPDYALGVVRGMVGVLVVPRRR
jgi:hypothetical protein